MAEMEPFNTDAEITSSLNDMSEEDLRSFAELHEDPANDNQIELYIHTCFLIFRKTLSREYLEQAVQRAEGWVAVTPADHPDRTRRSDILDMMSARIHQHKLILEDATLALLGITQMINQESPLDEIGTQISHLNDQAVTIMKNYQQTGSLEHLNEAIRIMEQAIDMTGRYIRPDMLSNLGAMLGMRFKRTGSMDDLNCAIDVASSAVDTTPQDHPDRAAMLNNLGNWLGSRFERTGSMDDLNCAIDVASSAVDTTPQDHTDRAGRLNNLGNWLGSRFERTGSMDDLNRAVDVASRAVDTTSQDHPDRAGCLNNLGNWLGTRFKQTGSMDDLNHAFSSYKDGWSCHTASPSIRIRLAQAVARILASQQSWEESSQLLEEAVNLLPTVSPRSLKHTDKQHLLADFAGLASTAAATALNAGKEAHYALQLLELGRGVIAGLLMDMRRDISDLKREHPDVASEFTSLRDKLDSPADVQTSLSPDGGVSSWELQAKRSREADKKFTELIMRIRSLHGFKNFLSPPTTDELMAAANPDPIIIVNLSSYRCDAFLIERDQIKVLELSTLTLDQVQKQAEELRGLPLTASFDMTSLLEWLWTAICRPCLDALGFKDPISDTNWPRVWWIPTGLLSQLPLHAAGYHARGCSETVLNRVMSSYASSVKALIHGRRQRSTGPLSDHALLVAMRETPGLSVNRILPSVTDEVKMLTDLCPSLHLQPITPPLRKDDILKQLQECKLFHFAGHGQSDPAEPSQNCLLLEDWKTNPLTVGDLRDSRLQENPPFLAYLSACSTGANEAVGLADEGIHLVSAFQLAGFRHVVGTLWEVSDKHCVDAARVLYETLRDEGMTDVAVCKGLHRAVRALRDGGLKKDRDGRDAKLVSSGAQARSLTDFYWVPYVHFGV